MLCVGYVFITSGVIKLIVHDFKGLFAGLGLPYPELTLFLVAVIEIACGMLIAGRMYIRFAAPPLILIMAIAIILTKIPTLTHSGFLSFAFEARLDIVMLILLFLIWKHGKMSVEYHLSGLKKAD